MAKLPGREPIYEAAERFVDAALRRDDSLFTPGRPIWTLEHLNDFYERFVLKPVTGKNPFMVKLKGQLAGAPPETTQLVAEMLCVHLLVPRDMGGNTKHEMITSVLELTGEPVQFPDEIGRAMDMGLVKFGFAHVQKFEHLRYLLKFLQHWKKLDPQTRTHLLADPWAFKEVAIQVEVPAAAVSRACLLHLVFPESFEAMISTTHKQFICQHFSYLADEGEGDVDRRLLQIRSRLSAEFGEAFSFYDPLVQPAWDPTVSAWDRFIYWAARFYRMPAFDRQERDYKLQVAEHMRAARGALLSGATDWQDRLKRAFGAPNNLTNWRIHSSFLEWCATQPKAAEVALRTIWDEREDPIDRLRRFLDLLPPSVISGPSGRLGIASILLMPEDPYRFAFYRTNPFNHGFVLTGYPPPDEHAHDAERYQHALEFLDRIFEEAAKRGLELRDRLDAQSLLWCVHHRAPEGWPEAEIRALRDYRQGHRLGEPVEDDDEPTVDPESALSPVPLKIGDLAESLLFGVEHLQRVEQLLAAKGQLIFYGPPGTGKTFVARELTRFFTYGRGHVEIVQFHPAYAYEDFVEGFRPRVVSGQPGFALVPGPLKRIAERARREPGSRHVLVIDEINRGNVAKVFGELYFLLEYRDEAISLQYSAEPFSLPANLWIIGTMNTADRSIALIDAALRRRFFFIPFFPDEEPIKGLLRRWLRRHRPEMSWVAAVVDRANSQLDDRHAGIGPSYFMRPDLTEEWVELIWRHQIIPYLEEHFFGEAERLKAFRLEHLRGSSGAADGATGLEETVAEDGDEVPPAD